MSPAVWSHSISARYELNDSTTILAGIDNLADEKPFRTEYSIPVSAVGRSMFVRASMRF
jgi:outer membrane receptor protein involved in Fe transport